MTKTNLEAAYAAGWRAAARWADRDDLPADIGSPAYKADMDAALEGLASSAEPSAVKPHTCGCINACDPSSLKPDERCVNLDLDDGKAAEVERSILLLIDSGYEVRKRFALRT